MSTKIHHITVYYNILTIDYITMLSYEYNNIVISNIYIHNYN